MVAEVGKPSMEANKGLGFCNVTGAPLPDSGPAGGQVSTQHGALERHAAGRADLRHAVQPFRENVTVDDHGVAANRDCVAHTPTAATRTWFWCAASGSVGSTQPFTMNGQK